jgi:hypothetical protein
MACLLARIVLLLMLNGVRIGFRFLPDDLHIFVFDDVFTILLILAVFVLIDHFGVTCLILHILDLAILNFLVLLLRLCAVDYLCLLRWLLIFYYVSLPSHFWLLVYHGWLNPDHLRLTNVYMGRFSSNHLWPRSNYMRLCPYYLWLDTYDLWFSSDDSRLMPNNANLWISPDSRLLIANLWCLCISGFNNLLFNDFSLFINIALLILLLIIYLFVLLDQPTIFIHLCLLIGHDLFDDLMLLYLLCINSNLLHNMTCHSRSLYHKILLNNRDTCSPYYRQRLF